MKKTSKPYEIVYASIMKIPTEEGDSLMYLAMDDYSEIIFSPIISPLPKTDEEALDNLVKLFNGINDKYDRAIHSQTTVYVTNFPPEVRPFANALIMKGDELIYDPERTEEALTPFFESFFGSMK